MRIRHIWSRLSLLVLCVWCVCGGCYVAPDVQDGFSERPFHAEKWLLDGHDASTERVLPGATGDGGVESSFLPELPIEGGVIEEGLRVELPSSVESRRGGDVPQDAGMGLRDEPLMNESTPELRRESHIDMGVTGGWIGDTCRGTADCGYTGARCLLLSNAKQKVCSLSCQRLCPDRVGERGTFCIDSGTGGVCVARCDVKRYPGVGCPAGEVCVSRDRFGQSSVSVDVCLPKEKQSGCVDNMNKQGDDRCYLQMVSWGDTVQQSRIEKLLKGTATRQDALAFLDRNAVQTRVFLKQAYGISKVHPNRTVGHASSRPMVGMVVHYSANQHEAHTARYFSQKGAHASTHFLLGADRNGLVLQLFSHRNRTWHAGSAYNIERFGVDFANAGPLKKVGGKWVDYMNRAYTMDLPLHGKQPVKVTGGIPGGHKKYSYQVYWQPYTYYQLVSFLVVGRALHLVYGLQSSRCQRHGELSSNRVDPGPALPTTALLQLVFSKDNIWNVLWLRAYKKQADWIAKNPQAR